MIGYIGLNQNMTFGKSKTKLNKGQTYIYPGDTTKGFTFFKNIEDIEGSTRVRTSRIFKIEVPDNSYVSDRTRKCRARQLVIKEEIPYDAVKKYLQEKADEIISKGDYLHRKLLADFKIASEQLAEDPIWLIRAKVAESGYNPKKFCSDEDLEVRKIAYSKMKRRK